MTRNLETATKWITEAEKNYTKGNYALATLNTQMSTAYALITIAIRLERLEK